MTPDNIKLTIIKLVHTIIWFFFNIVLFYMAYAVIVNKIGIYVWIGFGLVSIEGIVLLAFNMLCPLSIMARKYTTSKKDNFDIYIPNGLAKYNKQIYTTLFIAIIMGVILRKMEK